MKNVLIIILLLVFSLPTWSTPQLDNLMVGGTTPITTNTILDVRSTTKASVPCPVMTTVQRDAIVTPSKGMCIFNSTTNQMNTYSGTTWENEGTGGALNGLTDVINTNPNNLDVLIYSTGDSAYVNRKAVLNDITGVNVSSPVTGEILRHNGTNWVNTANIAANVSYDANYTLTDLANKALNQGISEGFVITDAGGLGLTWATGKIYDIASKTFKQISAGSGSCSDDTTTYLYWGSGTTLTLSTAFPSPTKVAIANIVCQGGDIISIHAEEQLNARESAMAHSLEKMFPVVVSNGLVVSEDTNVTNVWDVTLSAGAYYVGGHTEEKVAQIKSINTAMVRYFKSGGVWTTNTNAQIDVTQYNNGTALAAVEAAKYYKSCFYVGNAKINWVYPSAGYATLGLAVAAACPSVPAMANYASSTSVIIKGDETAFPPSGTRWQDTRQMLGISSSGSSTGSHADLSDLTTGDDHTQYALLAGRSGGQLLKGSTGASENLTLQSTNNVTRGFIVNNDAVKFEGSTYFKEGATPAAIPTYASFYTKTNDLPYVQDGNGIENRLAKFSDIPTNIEDANVIFDALHSVHDIFNDTINFGIMDAITVTDGGGLNFSWSTGELYDVTSGTSFNTLSGTSTCTNNNSTYLYWVSGTSLTVSTTPHVDPQIPVAIVHCQAGNIISIEDEPIIKTRESDTTHALSELIPAAVASGVIVSEDTNVTNVWDVVISAGEYYVHAQDLKTISTTYSRITPMTRHYKSGGNWASDTNATINTTQYNDGTNLAAVSATSYYKSCFYINGNIHWVYPTTGFANIANAQAAPCPTLPPGLAGLPASSAVVIRGNDTAFPSTASGRWLDIRPILGVAATGLSVTSHSDLSNLTSDDHTQYALLAGRSGGQTVSGDTAAGGSLTLKGTANAVQGTINLASTVVASQNISAPSVNGYIDNSGFEIDTNGWFKFDDGAAYVDGTGGTDANTTIARNTTTPLDGVADLKITETGNCLGEGVSKDFTIPKTMQGKVLNVEFEKDFSDVNYADGNTLVYLYDKSNAVIKEVTDRTVWGGKNKFKSSFQADSNSLSYRLSLMCNKTDATTTNLYIDDVVVSKANTVSGYSGTDWIAYTPTTGLTGCTPSGFYRRIGDSAEVQFKCLFTTSLGGTANFTIPSGIAIDTAKLSSLSSTIASQFDCSFLDSGTAVFNGSGNIQTGSTVTLDLNGAAGTYLTTTSAISSSVPMTWANGDTIYCKTATPLPILGWSSNTIMSDDATQRMVAGEVYPSANQTLAPNNSYVKVPMNTISGTLDGGLSFDDTNDSLIVPVTGWYSLSGRVGFSASTNFLANFYEPSIYINGVIKCAGTTTIATVASQLSNPISCLKKLNKGDYVQLYFFGAGNNSSNTLTSAGGASTYTYLQVVKAGDPSTISSTENVYAAYYASASTSNLSIAQSATEVVDYDTKIEDTHNAVTIGTGWKFTAPFSGLYQVNAVNALALQAAGTTIALYISTTQRDYLKSVSVSSLSTDVSCSSSATVRLSKGEIIQIKIRHDDTANNLSTGDSISNMVTIMRVGL